MASYRSAVNTTVLPFAAAAFLGSALLFSLEPMAGKLVLPQLGGAPAVWNTCLLFFQAMLLAGYAWADQGLRRIGVRRHATVHAILLVASLAVLPPALSGGTPPATGSPIPWLLFLLVRTIGLPFFLLSTTAPLVQAWLARTSDPAARDPYFLYAASNLGGLAGLAFYPFVLEPLVGLRMQTIGWAAAYAIFVVLVAVLAWRARSSAVELAPITAAHGNGSVDARTALRWTAIAFVPSALLLTVTGHITTDVAPMPLLWLAPLGLYLATFVAAFGARTRRAAGGARLIQPVLTLAVAATVLAGFNAAWMLPVHLLLLTVVAYLAHARLASERPDASRLTAFYLWISVGGVIGGVFGAIVAPMLLMPEHEYALLALLALLLPGPGTSRDPPRLARVMAVIAVAALAGTVAAVAGHAGWAAALFGLPAFAALLMRIDRNRAALAITAAVVLVAFAATMRVAAPANVVARERNFFGTLRVRASPGLHTLMHGRIAHGSQFTAPDSLDTPTTYFAREGPLGDIFASIQANTTDAHVGIIGLGAGTVVCYARPGETWDLYEINPAVISIARDTTLFRFLDRCGRDATMITGDGRRALASAEVASYDMLVLDAFSSDAIPTHLLTREAFALYLTKLKPDGILAVHISNRYLDLEPVIAANAAALAAAAVVRKDVQTAGTRRAASVWVALAKDEAAIDVLSGRPDWGGLRAEENFRPWTDDYTNLLAVVRAFR